MMGDEAGDGEKAFRSSPKKEKVVQCHMTFVIRFLFGYMNESFTEFILLDGNYINTIYFLM